MDDNTRTWIKESIGGNQLDSVETVMSAEHNKVHKIDAGDKLYFLKCGPKLNQEHDRLVWLAGKLPVPKVIAWRQTDNNQHELLTTGIKGENLAELANRVAKKDLIDWLASTLRLIHNVDIADCPFGDKQSGYVFTHGDACLPNFIFRDGKLEGIIDIGDAGINDLEVDLAAAVWTLNNNCGPGYALPLLKAYGLAAPSHRYATKLAEWYSEKRIAELHSVD
jgi:aminoglycoside phosphotransferase